MADENGTGSNVIWALAAIIIVAIIAGVLFYSGILSGKPKVTEEKININVGSSR